ncbi:hypothetical protein CHUAL_011839 [Chamberlinius hualienensis]
MKLRNCSNLRSSVNAISNTAKPIKLENNLKRHSSTSEKVTSNSKVTSSKKLSPPKATDGSESTVVASPEHPSSSSSTLVPKTKDAQANGIMSVKSAKEVSKTKKCHDIDFIESDNEEEEEVNLNLKTLKVNLDKGSNLDEVAKKSQEMIDDLMHILKKDDKLDRSVENKEDSSSKVEVTVKSANNPKNKLPKESNCSGSTDGKIKLRSAKQNSTDNSDHESVTSKNDSRVAEKPITEVSETRNEKDVLVTYKSVLLANYGSQPSAGLELTKKLSLENDSKTLMKDVSKELVRHSAGSNEMDKNVGNTEELGTACGKTIVSNSVEIPSDSCTTVNNKRSAEILTENPDPKRLKNDVDESAAGKEKRYRLTKPELEMLVITKVTEFFNEAHKSEIGALRKRCENLEKALDQWRRKATTYQKQVTDLQIAVQRVQIKRQVSKPAMRSVGLQVNMIKDLVRLGNQLHSSGNKQTMVIPSSLMKNHTLVLPKQTQTGQMAFYTNLGTHGALSNAAILSNVAKSTAPSTILKSTPTTSSSTNSVGILPAKLGNPSTASMTVSSSITPVPMRLVQNQAVRPVAPTSVNNSSANTTSQPLTVSVVNQNPLVKCIDLTVEEENQKNAAAAAGVAVSANAGAKRVASKPITTLSTTNTLPAGLAMVSPLNTSSSTVTVINTANASVANGQLLAINSAAALSGLVSAVGTQGTVGVTTAIRGPTPSPVATGPLRFAYLGANVTLVRPSNGSPVFLTANPPLNNRPLQPGSQPILRSPISATALLLRQNTTILPVQNGQNQTTAMRPIQPVLSTKIVTKNGISSTSSSINSSSTTAAKTTPPVKTTAPTSTKPTAPTSTKPAANAMTTTPKLSTAAKGEIKHPAPLPPRAQVKDLPGWKYAPTKPVLKLSKADNGIVLSWNMNLTESHATVASYQLFAYQESSVPPNSSLWKKVGDVRALPLPMACTLTQFVEGHRYYFAVRAVDCHNRPGPFSDAGCISLTKATAKKT